jgi:predicted nuclease of restriction endonuclease-like (RecB) superfamily
MRKLFMLLEKLATVSQQLTYGHYVELLPYEDINKVKYYIKIIEEQNLSIRQLRDRIKANEYERLPEDSKNKLISKDKSTVVDFVKNPIIIKNSNNYEIISEKILQRLILEDIESFMKELGNSFSFIGSEYKIRISNNFNYIDFGNYAKSNDKDKVLSLATSIAADDNYINDFETIDVN